MKEFTVSVRIGQRRQVFTVQADSAESAHREIRHVLTLRGQEQRSWTITSVREEPEAGNGPTAE